MNQISSDKENKAQINDQDVIKSLRWFLSFISKSDWERRKGFIESKISFGYTDSASKNTPLVIKDDLIGWYLYLAEIYVYEHHKYEYYQGARIIPIFQRLGKDLDHLKCINGLEKRVKDILRKRKSEADSLLFEILVALLWVKNGYKVTCIPEEANNKTPDFCAERNGKILNIECKRQSKTSDYTYLETRKRQKMISHISDTLLKHNCLLEVSFHVELHTLPDTYLKDLLHNKLPLAISGKIVQNDEIDVDLSFVDIPAIKKHLNENLVKYNSPLLNQLIANKPVDNKAFTCSILAKFIRKGEGEANNLYVDDISNAYGVHWTCDSQEAIWAKARNIKTQLHKAISQLNSSDTAVIHIGMETYDGPEVERQRLDKIFDTLGDIKIENSNLEWLFLHYFQSYSPPDQLWVFDETTQSIYFNKDATCPLDKRFLIVPEENSESDAFHWERPLP
jgi:hypothetical protein